MALVLSTQDIRQLQTALSVLARPLDYESADAWRGAVLQTTSRLFDADAASFVLPASDEPAVTLFNRPQSYLDTFLEYQASDPALQLWIGKNCPEIFTTESLSDGDRRVYTENQAYVEAYHKYNVEEAVTLMLDLADNPPLAAPGREFKPGGVAVQGMLTVYSERVGCPRFGEQGMALMSLLRPLVGAAAQTWNDLTRSRTELGALFEHAGSAMCICAPDGVIRYRNPVYEQMVSQDPHGAELEQSCIRVARGVSELAHGSSGQLDREVLTATQRYRVRGTFTTSLVLPGGAVIISIEPKVMSWPSAERLRRRFGLTRREAQVALLLAQGDSNATIAQRIHIATTTARRHTESVMRKLNVSSRAKIGPTILTGSD